MPESAVTRLVQGIYENDPEQARRISRLRIYSTVAPSVMCRGMVKVAARRMTVLLEPSCGPTVQSENEVVEVFPTTAVLATLPLWEKSTKDRELMALALELGASVERRGPLHASNRPIAALLVGAYGEVFAAAVNSNARNRTQHAEVNLLQGYFSRTGRAIPRGTRIITTLKPCRMCAAMIWHCSEDVEAIRVAYGEHDPGPNARVTILDAGSPDRRDWAGARPHSPIDKLQLERLVDY